MCTVGKWFSAVNGLPLLFVLFFVVSCSDMMDSYDPPGQGEEVVRTTADEWIQVENTGFPVGEYIYGVSYGNGRFVAFGYDKVAYSDNGRDWNHTSEPWFAGTGSMFADAAYGDGVWIIVAAGGPPNNSRLGRSVDNAVSWSEINDHHFDSSIYGVIYSNGRFVAVGYNGIIEYSDDRGLTWNPATVPASANDEFFEVIAYGGGVYLVNSRYSANTWKSSIGNEEEWFSTNASTSSSRDMIYGKNHFVNVSGSVISIQYWDYTGDCWVNVNDNDLQNLSFYSIAYGGTLYVAVGRDQIAYTNNIDDWTISYQSILKDDLENPVTPYDVEYGKGVFVAVGQQGRISYSIK